MFKQEYYLELTVVDTLCGRLTTSARKIFENKFYFEIYRKRNDLIHIYLFEQKNFAI